MLDVQRSQCVAPAHVDHLEYCPVAHDAQLASAATWIASARCRLPIGDAVMAAFAGARAGGSHAGNQGRIRPAMARTVGRA